MLGIIDIFNHSSRYKATEFLLNKLREMQKLSPKAGFLKPTTTGYPKQTNDKIVIKTKSSNMNEITFLIEESPEGGFNAHAVGASIFTEAENISELHHQIRDAVMCHFEEGKAPKTIRLQFVREEVIAL